MNWILKRIKDCVCKTRYVKGDTPFRVFKIKKIGNPIL